VLCVVGKDCLPNRWMYLLKVASRGVVERAAVAVAAAVAMQQKRLPDGIRMEGRGEEERQRKRKGRRKAEGVGDFCCGLLSVIISSVEGEEHLCFYQI
jgi:hypothetical protein